MYGAPRDLPVLTHSFPPRLSSDLNAAPALEQYFVLAPLRHRCGPPAVPAIMAVHRTPGKPAGPALERVEIRWNRWPFSRRHRETPQGRFVASRLAMTTQDDFLNTLRATTRLAEGTRGRAVRKSPRLNTTP